MAALQCEICGGKLIGKPGGVFECDSCGMEYSTEWAKAKVQEIKGTVKIEGPVEVTGTVKVEGGGPNVENLLSRGLMILEEATPKSGKKLPEIKELVKNAESLFQQVLTVDPKCAEAYLGLAMAGSYSDTREAFAQQYLQERSGFESSNLLHAREFAQGELKAWLEDLEQKRQEVLQARQAAKDAFRQRMRPLWKLLREAPMIAYERYHLVGLKADGTVVAVGDNSKGQCNVTDWTDMIAVSVGRSHTVGLRANGTVAAVGDRVYRQCNVTGWTDIVAVSAGDSHTVGLKADGTVVAVGDNGEDQCDVTGWTGIVAVSAGYAHTMGLRADGTGVMTKLGNISDWTDIVALSSDRTILLRADGTVAGNERVADWTELVAVAAQFEYIVGLRADGTVVLEDRVSHRILRNFYPSEVSDWKLFDDLEATLRERAEKKAKIAADWRLRQEAERQEAERQRKAAEAEAERQRKEAEAKRQAEEAARQAKIAALNTEKASIQAELPTIKGLFSGGKRRELEARLAQIEKELSKL